MYKFEPVLMQLNGDAWQHPNIESVLTDYSIIDNEICIGSDETFYSENMIRIMLDLKGKRLNIVAVAEKEFYEEFLNTFEELNDGTEPSPTFNVEFMTLIEVMLFDDVWGPSEQFCFSKFGKKVNKFHNKDTVISWTPDICVHGKDQDWSWST